MCGDCEYCVSSFVEIVSTVSERAWRLSTLCFNVHGDGFFVSACMEIVSSVCLNVLESTKSHILNFPSTHRLILLQLHTHAPNAHGVQKVIFDIILISNHYTVTRKTKSTL